MKIGDLHQIAIQAMHINRKFNCLKTQPKNGKELSKEVRVDIALLEAEIYSYQAKMKEDFQAACNHDWRGSIKDHIKQKCEICDKIELEDYR